MRGHDLDPDEWFPLAAKPARARAEAARALAVCAACPVRAECLELSLRTWSGAGQHGIWGGLVEADRNSLRQEWLRGAPVTVLLPRPSPGPADQDRARLAAGPPTCPAGGSGDDILGHHRRPTMAADVATACP